MADWQLFFERAEPIALASCEASIAEITGAPVTIERSALRGNPRDGFDLDVTLRTARPGGELSVALTLAQALRMENDPEPHSWIRGVTLGGSATFEIKHAAWQRLGARLGELGCRDVTIERYPGPGAIIDDAIAEGEHAHAARLRAAVTDALVTAAETSTRTGLGRARAAERSRAPC